jgi:hypothetical protein
MEQLASLVELKLCQSTPFQPPQSSLAVRIFVVASKDNDVDTRFAVNQSSMNHQSFSDVAWKSPREQRKRGRP